MAILRNTKLNTTFEVEEAFVKNYLSFDDIELVKEKSPVKKVETTETKTVEEKTKVLPKKTVAKKVEKTTK